MLRRSGFAFTRVVPSFAFQKPSSANIVYGEAGKCWKYDPDFEPTEPCLRAGLKGNPYGTRENPLRTRVTGRKLYRLPLKHPLWKDVYQTLDDVGVGRDWLDLTIPAVLPEFPMEAKKQNPYYKPGKYPTIRNAYYEQQKVQLAAEKEAHIKEFYYKKHRLRNRWARDRQQHEALQQALAEISPNISEDAIDADIIQAQTKAIEGTQQQ